MGFLTLKVIVVTLMLTSSSVVIIGATQSAGEASIDIPQLNRTSKEFQEKSRSMKDPVIVELKTTGRKFTSDDYNTFSSLTSDIVVETPSSTANPKVFPSLTTGPPPFITRGRYIRNPFYYSKDDQEVEFDDDQQAELLLNAGVPKWNRYSVVFI